ncbi:MAG: SRPBCC family protein [Alphaproteobacteria bacterium]|nr:MAG: SRPBCC family protein [Alphaproteobacteria bacterium]
MRTVLLTLIAGLLLLTFGVFTWAAILPATTTASKAVLIPAPITQVFARVTDPASQVQWRRDITAVTLVDGPQTWLETTRQGLSLTMREVAKEHPTRYAIQFTSPHGFQGEWVGLFRADGDQTMLHVTETVTVDGWLNRVLARLFSPPGAHLDLYLADLMAAMERR